MSTKYTVRVMRDGLLLTPNHMFTRDQEHTAYAYYDSSVDRYRRLDDSKGVTVQLFDANGSVLAEETFA